MIMDLIFCTGLLFFSPCVLHAQSFKEASFENTAKLVVQKLAQRDSAGLAKYVDNTTGVYILFRIGVQDDYKRYSKIGFHDSAYPNAPFYNKVRYSKIKYSVVPTYDCNKWTKTGTFADTTITDHLLSKTARRLNLYLKRKIPPKTISSFVALESVSRKIVIADNNGNDLIFYLSYINNKWYLTIIDKITTDCSV